MPRLVNRAKMTTSTTGTGNITLGSASSGFQSFADAGVADGDTVRYVIEDGTAWEIGSGVYTASGTTLTRSVLESSNSDSAINLTGSATVFVTAVAEDVTASRTFARWDATDNQPPATAFATLDTRNSIAVLDFDDATKESAVFVGVMPEYAALGSGLQVRLHWMATSATSGSVRWEVALERSNTDLDSDSFDTVATGATTTSGTSGIVTATSISLTTIDSVAAGDLFRIRVARDAANGADTMAGDAELVAVEARGQA